MEPMEGIFDNMILNLLKDALDVSKIDKPKLKSAVSLAADACKPATKLPADLDDKGWDMLKDAANVLIDKIGVQEPITVGAAGDDIVLSAKEYTVADVDSLLASMPAGTVDAKCCRMLRKHPEAMKKLYATRKDGTPVFTEEQRNRVVGNPLLLQLLIAFAPTIISFILKLLGS
jgi:hypothetical protein